MKKQIRYFLTISSLMVILTFSGCIEQNSNINEVKELEILSYNITTEAYSFNTNWEYFGDGFYPNNLPEISPNRTIYLPEEYYKARYRINVTVKNIVDYTLNKVTVNLIFYDENNQTLTSEQLKNYSDLQSGLTRFLEYEYDYYDKYFKDVDHLEITTGILPKYTDIEEN